MKLKGMVQLVKLSESELKQINGGVSAWAVIGVIASLIFGTGAVDGWARPLRCRGN